MRKFNYYKVIQQNYGQGWEDVSFYESDSTGFILDKKERETFKHDLKEYRFTGYATRAIKRRELKK